MAIFLRGTIPLGLSIFAVNGFFSLVAVIRLDAIKRFLVEKSLNRLFYTLPILVALAAMFFYFADDRIEIRTFILSNVLFLLSVLISWNLVRYSPPENKLLYYSAGIFIAARGLTLLTWAILWQINDQEHILDAGIWSSIHFEFGLISEVGQNLIFLMMNSKRAEKDFIESRSKLNSTVFDLRAALSEVKKLQGILPICSYCKKIRDDHGAWQGIEEYVRKRSDVEFSHGICPGCAEKYFPDMDLYSD
ncbi:hypothetical protein [Desulforapulum autotrophicum]|nr:hypothetical protein [Desulforapulum autotrophicum]